MKYRFQDLIPILFIIYIFTSYISKYLGYMYEILATIFFLLIISYKKKIYFSLSMKIILLLFLFIFLGSVYSSVSATIIKTILATLPILILGMYIVIYDHGNIEKYFPILSLGSFFFSFITILSFLFPNVYTEFILNSLPNHIKNAALNFYIRGRYAGITNQTGLNGWFFVIGLGISFSYLISKQKLRYLFFILFYFITIILTGRRGHLLFSILSMAIIYMMISSDKLKSFIIIVFLTVCMTITSFFLFPDILSAIMEKSFSGNYDYTSGRFGLWQTALETFKINPVFGVGFGYFSLHMGLNVHNVYIQFLTEVGIVGFSLLILMICLNIANVVKVLSIQNIKKSREIIFSAFIQYFFVFYCFTESGFNDLHVLVLYFASVCVIEKKLYDYRRMKCIS